MPFLVFIGALFVPRGAILLLWLLSNWFDGVFDTLIWPLLGFLFAPLTLLWYSVVIQVYGGQWDTLQIVILVIAALIDFSPSAKSKRRKKSE